MGNFELQGLLKKETKVRDGTRERVQLEREKLAFKREVYEEPAVSATYG